MSLLPLTSRRACSAHTIAINQMISVARVLTFDLIATADADQLRSPKGFLLEGVKLTTTGLSSSTRLIGGHTRTYRCSTATCLQEAPPPHEETRRNQMISIIILLAIIIIIIISHPNWTNKRPARTG